MKHILTLFVLTFNLSVSAQSAKYAGDYEVRYETDKGEVIEYTLSLQTNGMFLFHFYRHLGKAKPEENYYGRGKWNDDKNLISLYTDVKNDIDDTHTLNFNNSKARIISKSPRDKSTKIIKILIICQRVGYTICYKPSYR